MNWNQNPVEELQIVPAIMPVNLASAANNGDWVSLKGYQGCLVVFVKGVGAASQDPTLTLLQSTAVAGSPTASLNFTTIYVKEGSALTAVGEFTEVTQSAANTYTDNTAGENQVVWVIDVKAEMLDIDGGYDCIRASIADTGSTSQIGTVLYILYGPRYGEKVLLSAIAD